eukprot:9166285-Pyramimonas_sp.AAC.1
MVTEAAFSQSLCSALLSIAGIQELARDFAARQRGAGSSTDKRGCQRTSPKASASWIPSTRASRRPA